MKAVALKPVMWNTNGYIRPSGYPSTSGFSKDNGYGHEEWNNNPRRVWRDYKIFHTESTEKLLRYSSTGELAIITTASFEGSQYAISIATNVFDNDEDERRIIAQELNIHDTWKEVWSVDRVKQCFSDDKRRFLEHWQRSYEWIGWKCPIAQYHHFNSPVRLDPFLISGKARLILMHGRFQAIYPEQALQIIGDALPEDHPIREWLASADFDEEIISRTIKNFRSAQKIRPPRRRSESNAPAIRAYQYWVEGNRSVEPHHAEGLYLWKLNRLIWFRLSTMYALR